MGPVLVAVLIAAAGLTYDISVNALQNWYDVTYTDAFWTYRVPDSPALRQVAHEEAEIDRLMRGQDFVAPRDQ
jgi:hypothetical protein